MALPVLLPKLGMTMEEGTITEWHVSDGDHVQRGDALFSFETEKVNYEVTSEAAGIVRMLFAADATVPAGAVVAYILAEGEALPRGAPEPFPEPAVSESPARSGGPEHSAEQAAGQREVLRASPAARRLAADHGIALEAIAGSGPEGRILREDVERAIAESAAPPAAPQVPARTAAQITPPSVRRYARERGVELRDVLPSGADGRIGDGDVDRAAAGTSESDRPSGAPERRPLEGDVPYRGIRRAVGDRMFQSLQSTAQVSAFMEADVTDAARLRRDLLAEWESDGPRLTYTDLVLRAVALALRHHPRLNSVLDGELVRVQPAVHLGVAVALDEGLLVPVIRDAEAKSLRAIALESADLGRRARAGELLPDELSGATFTVSSLGMYGVDGFTPVIDPPQAAILGVGRVVERPAFVSDRGNEVERRAYLTLSVTVDHRIVDGVPAARFLQSVRHYLEHPYLLVAAPE